MKQQALLILGGLLAVAAIGLGCYSLVSLMAHERTTTEIRFADIERIELDLSVGGIELVAGSDGSVVSGQRLVDRGLQQPTFSEDVIDGTLRLIANCPDFAAFNCGSRYKLTVPAGVDVSGDSSGGSITITGVTGALTVDSSGGDITVRDPAGPLKLSTSSGGIIVTGGRSAEVFAHSSNAGVSLEFAKSPSKVDAESSSGDVTVILPGDDAFFAIDASSDNGDPTVNVRIDPASERRIRVYSSSGNVTVRYAEPGP